MALKGNHIGSVYIKVRPDAKNFRRETQRQVGKEPIEVELRIDEDKARRDLGNAADRVTRDTQSRARIAFEPVMDRMEDAKRRVKKILSDLGVHKVDLDLNTDSLKDARKDITDAIGDDVKVTLKYVDDEEGLQDVLDTIEEIRREQAEVEVTFETDASSLSALERDIQSRLSALGQNKDPMQVIFGGSEETINRVIADIERELERLDDVDLTIDVDREELEKAKQDLQELKASAATLALRSRSGDTSTIRPIVDPFSYAIANTQLNALAHDRWVTIRTRVAGRLSKMAMGSFLSLAGLNSITAMINQIEHVVTHFDEVAMSAGTMGAAIGTAVSVGTVAIGALLTTVRDMAQVFQLAAMAPTMLLSGMSGLMTYRAVWNGMEAALIGIPGALEKLPPAAQGGIKAIQDLQAATEQVVQQNFWAKMNGQIERFTKLVGPTVTDAMGAVSDEMGRAVSEMLDHLIRLTKSGDLRKFAAQNALFYHELADAANPFFKGFMDMAFAGGKYLPKFGRYLRNMADGFQDFADEAVRTQKLDLWVMNGVNAFKRMSSVVGSTLGILGNFTRIFDNLNVGGLDALANGMERVAAFTASAGFQSKMQNVFAGAVDGARSAAVGFGDLMAVLYEFDDLTAELLRRSGTLAGTFMSGLGQAMNQPKLHQGMLDLFDGLNDFVRDAQPAFDSISRIIGNLATVAGEVSRQIAPGMNITFGLVDQLIDRLGPSLVNAVQPLTSIFEMVTVLATGPLSVMANTAAILLDTFNALPGPIQSVLLTLLAASKLLPALQVGMSKAMKPLMGGGAAAYAGIGPKAGNPMQVYMANAERSVREGGTRIQSAWAGTMAGMRRTTQVSMGYMKSAMGGLRSALGMGGLMGALGGPWMMALMGGIAVLGHFATAQAEAEQRTAAMTDAIKDQARGVEGAMREGIFTNIEDGLTKFAEAGGNIEKVITDIENGNVTQVIEDLELAMGYLGGTAGKSKEEIAKFFDPAYVDKGEAAMRRYGITADMTANDVGTLLDAIRNNEGDLSGLNSKLEVQAAILKATGQELEGMSDLDFSSKYQLMADALSRFADEASSAEERARGLGDAMRQLAGNETTDARELESQAGSIMEGINRDLAAMAKEKIDWGSVFDDAGNWDLVNSSVARQMRTIATDGAASFENELMAIQIDLDQGLISEEQAAAKFDAVFAKAASFGESVVEQMGLSGTTAGKRIAENIDLEMSHLTAENYEVTVDAAKTVEKAKGDIESLKAAGYEMSEAHYEFFLDANGDGAVTELERVSAIGEMIDARVFNATVTGDAQGAQDAIMAALDMGIAWDGKSWVASIGADGQPTQAVMNWANSMGISWDGKTWVATVDADEVPALNSATRATTAIQNVPDKTAYINASVTGLERVQALQRYINGLRDRNLSINTHFTASGTAAARAAKPRDFDIGMSDGGILGARSGYGPRPSAIRAYADGGISPKPMSAHIVPAGSYVLYGERETGGEAFIPLSASKRDRSLAIWQEVGKRFGAFADGGVTTTGGGSGPVFNIHNQYPQAEATSVTINKALAQAGHPLGGEY